MRIYTTYLKIKYKDEWEKDWRKFRDIKKKNGEIYLGYSIIGLVNFLLLGVSSFFLPIYFSFISINAIKFSFIELYELFQNLWFVISWVIFCLYVTCVIMFTFKRKNILDENMKDEIWKEVLKE